MQSYANCRLEVKTSTLCQRRFEIRNSKSEKWESMFYIYLVENFFLAILRRRIFLGFEIKKKLFRGAKRDLLVRGFSRGLK